MSDALNGARLETLRHILGQTQKEFGLRLEINQSYLSRLERGDAVLGPDLAHKASAVFGEPISFFSVPTVPVPLGPVAFRRKSSTRAAERDRISALYREAARVFSDISAASGYRELVEMTDWSHTDAEGVAELVRRMAGLDPEQPVANVTRLFERLGIGVVTELDDPEHSHDLADVSGITMPTARNRRPLVALAAVGRGDVQRLTIAHEVGHLILDRDAPSVSCSTRSPQERAAFDFGGALLLPHRVVRSRLNESSTFRDFIALKSEYGMSISAITKRAHTLGIISSDRYRILQIQMSSRGWRFDEPVEVAVERPILFDQAIRKLYPSATFARASHVLGARPDRLRRWAGSVVEEEVPTKENVTPLRRIRRQTL